MVGTTAESLPENPDQRLVSTKDEIVNLLLFPSSRGGVDATSKNIAEGIL
jgi:hypothetical protein